MLNINNGTCALCGDLTFLTTPQLKAAGELLLTQTSESVISFDLQNVNKVDSSALALFLDWQRLAKAKMQTLQFTNIPTELNELAALYSLQQILPFVSNE